MFIKNGQQGRHINWHSYQLKITNLVGTPKILKEEPKRNSKLAIRLGVIYGYHEMVIEGEIYTVSKISKEGWLLRETGCIQWGVERFELVEQPEPQIDDVWGSEDKQHIIKIIAIFNAYDGEKCYSYLVLKSNRVSKDSASFLPLRFAEVFPPSSTDRRKKQPKTTAETAEKARKKCGREFFQSNEDYRCGNKIKVIYQGYEGLAVCNKHDKFDLMFGVNLAAHRAMVKYHQNVIEMIKEGK